MRELCLRTKNKKGLNVNATCLRPLWYCNKVFFFMHSSALLLSGESSEGESRVVVCIHEKWIWYFLREQARVLQLHKVKWCERRWTRNNTVWGKWKKERRLLILMMLMMNNNIILNIIYVFSESQSESRQRWVGICYIVVVGG